MKKRAHYSFGFLAALTAYTAISFAAPVVLSTLTLFWILYIVQQSMQLPHRIVEIVMTIVFFKNFFSLVDTMDNPVASTYTAAINILLIPGILLVASPFLSYGANLRKFTSFQLPAMRGLKVENDEDRLKMLRAILVGKILHSPIAKKKEDGNVEMNHEMSRKYIILCDLFLRSYQRKSYELFASRLQMNEVGITFLVKFGEAARFLEAESRLMKDDAVLHTEDAEARFPENLARLRHKFVAAQKRFDDELEKLVHEGAEATELLRQPLLARTM